MFTCNQSGFATRWKINLPNIAINNIVLYSSAGIMTNFTDDPDFGFEIHVLHSSSSSSVNSELRVTTVMELNGVTVECTGCSGRFTSTILIAATPG